MTRQDTGLVSHPVPGLKGRITPPGDKSISHRALILSSQLLGTTRIHGLLQGEDVLRTANALESLGVPVQTGDVWEVSGVGIGGLSESKNVLDMGNSGTSARLLMGLVTPYPFSTFFTGDESLRKRPMGRVVKPLSEMGATVVSGADNRLPLALTGTDEPMPIRYRLPVPSAQVKSAILLAGLNTRGTTTVIEPVATRDHTENMMQGFGLTLHIEKEADGAKAISIPGQQTLSYAERELHVPADPSSAAFPLVAATLCQDSEIILENVCINPLRTGLFLTLQEMGARIEYRNKRIAGGEPVADIAVASAPLTAVEVPAERAPSMIDEYPILAVAASFAKGETVMHGLGELRVKESDRLLAIVALLTACGVEARIDGDTLYVKGGNPKGGAKVAAQMDHRIAMSALVMGMAAKEPVEVDDASSIATSFPQFSTLMNRLGAQISATGAAAAKPVVIAVDGPAASGKGTLARRLAEHFGLDYLDTGSLYRAVGMKLIYGGKDPSDKAAALEAARTIDADDLANPRLRQERIGQAASIVSAYPEVRQALLDFQRDFARKGAKGAVLDGRDIGTVVCPDADFKFFITATLYARARRRHRELSGEGIEVIFESVLEDLRERDERDEKRAVAPLKPASDAFIIDTSDMDASTVFTQTCEIVERGGKL